MDSRQLRADQDPGSTIVHLGVRDPTRESWGMALDHHLLAQLLSCAALLGATIEYGEIIKRRRDLREAAMISREAADTGLQGLVRVLLADEPQS